MTTNAVSSSISAINKEADKTGIRVVGEKIPNSARYLYRVERCAQEGAMLKVEPTQSDIEKPKASRVMATVAPMSPTLEQSSAYLAQYIANQLRQEFEATLSSVVADAVRTGIGSMMVGIRESVAKGMGQPQLFAKPASAIMAEDIAIPATKKEVTATVNTAALMEAVEKHERATNHVSSPILNVVSTRTKPREKTVAQPAEVANPAPEASQSKRKVIICSLLPMQQEIIRKEFGELMNLRMFYRDQEKALTKSVNHGDDVILMGDFISHRITQRIEAVGGKIEIVMGGLTKLREKLTEMYCTAKEAA